MASVTKCTVSNKADFALFTAVLSTPGPLETLSRCSINIHQMLKEPINPQGRLQQTVLSSSCKSTIRLTHCCGLFTHLATVPNFPAFLRDLFLCFPRDSRFPFPSIFQDTSYHPLLLTDSTIICRVTVQHLHKHFSYFIKTSEPKCMFTYQLLW